MTSSRDEIPAEVLSFIHSHIDSVEQLQILLILAEDGRAWTVDQLSKELRSTSSSVQKRLQDLQDRGVLSRDAVTPEGKVQFVPSSSENERLAKELAQLFRQRPHRVIAQIFARPNAAIQSFADSFNFKKEDK